MVRIYEKLHKATEQLVFFATRQWQFNSNNIPELYEQLQGIDRDVRTRLIHQRQPILTPISSQAFCFDVTKIEWPTYLKNYYMGIRRYILKEDVKTVPSARRKLRRLVSRFE